MATQGYGSRKDAADALGISRQRLEKLIKQGRIEESALGIDIAKARTDYEATIDPSKRAVYEGATADAPKRVRVGLTTVSDPESGKTIDFATARTEKELANAQRARLEYQIKSGAYIARDVVAAKEFAIARRLRDRILGFPARVANLVPAEAMTSLTEECEALVRELQEEAASIAEEGRA